MKRSFFALLMITALMSSAVNFTFARVQNTELSERQVNQLAAQLPVSDAVVVVDMQRLMKEVLPQALSGKVQVLNEMNAKIDEINGQIGVDLRQFDQLAVGLTIKQTAPKKFDYEPLILARGRVNAGALLTAARTAAKGKFREEKLGARTVYIFSMKEILQANKPKINNPKDEENFNKMVSRIPAELAVTTFDDSTLAVGTPARVRETFESKARVNQEILALVGRKPSSIMSFGGNVPAGLSQVLDLGLDEFSKIFDSMRQVYGSMDVSGANTMISIAAKTFKPEQAAELEDTLSGLQALGKGLLAGMSGADKQVYARMAENAKISRAGDEVTIDVQVANSDINILLGKK